jgi:GGDEF domain-containing protein
MIDLDHFTQVHDRMGPATADRVLRDQLLDRAG